MSPIDDELRATFRSRAAALVPSPDPLAGIERRAAKMRRNRIAAAVAGSALAVTALAVAVPALVGSSAPPRGFATVAPSSPPSSPATSYRPPNALRWPTVAATSGLDGQVKSAWAVDHKVDPTGVTLEVLYRGTTGDKGEVAAYQLWTAALPARVVIATSAMGQALLLTDEPATAASAYRAIVPGLANPWVVVVGGPGIVKIEYAENGVDFVQQPGSRTALFVRTGPTSSTKPDQVRTTDSKGFASTQPANPPGPTDGAPGTSDAEPTNLLGTWPQRGVLGDGPSRDDVAARFAQGMSRPGDKALYRPLYAGKTANGVRYSFGQAWFSNGTVAYDVGLTTGSANGPNFFLGRATPKDPDVRAYLVTGLPGATNDLLVVIPSPRTTQVLYDDNATGSLRPVNGTPATAGVVLIDRAFSSAGSGSDRLQLLTGNGDPAKDTTFRGSVSSLLCGLSGCG